MQNPAQLKHIKTLAGVIGLGTGGATEGMRRVWKKWSQTELLLILLEDASESEITKIVDKLIIR